MNFVVLLADIFIFVFGLCIGSFLNCVIYRLPDKSRRHFDGPATISPRASLGGEQWWLGGRSFCPHCKHQLYWQDLFPVFSFLFLQGKCRYCKKNISLQYPLVESITAFLFLTIFIVESQYTIYNILNTIFLFYISSVLIIIFVYDLKHYLIPDKILFPAIIIAFGYRLFENLINWSLIGNWKLEIGNFSLFGNYFFAALIASGFFLIIFLISRGRAMGFGDVKLAVLIGLLLGMPNVLVALFLAFFFGAIIGIMLMIFGRSVGWRMKSEVPFGPFLITGTFIALFWGERLANWYMKFF